MEKIDGWLRGRHVVMDGHNIQTIAAAPWLLIPGVVVITAAVAFNLVGDGLRDAADPYGH